MIRPIFTELVLFLAPFGAYAIFLLVTRAKVMDRDAWPTRVVAGLVVAALVLVFGGLVVFAHFSGAPPHSNYEPAHMENGVFVPGRTR